MPTKYVSAAEKKARAEAQTRATVKVTAEKEESVVVADEKPVQEPQKSVTFGSPYRNYTVVVRSGKPEAPGHRLEFADGRYTTANPDDIRYLRGSKAFGKDIFEI